MRLMASRTSLPTCSCVPPNIRLQLFRMVGCLESRPNANDGRENRLLLVIHPLTRQLIARLSHAELIGRQLGRIHTIHELLFGGGSLCVP